ncbi:hypothetical protein [Sorangium sp. So ce854]|uniref:hypothetical protein n=1 Tax=Sorangium sp. So ce854 TaxID=3133322 RepID=UPI003F5FDFD3
MLGAELLDAQRPPCLDIVEPSIYLIQEREVDMLALEAVIVVEPARIDEGDVSLPVQREDLLVTRANLVCELRELGLRLAQGYDVLWKDRRTLPPVASR